MLAFTMQFSRYGRNLTYSAPIQGPFGQAVRVSALCEAAASSGPNSVLGAPSVTCPRSVAPRGENVLAEQLQESEPNSQCSTRKHGRSRRHSLRKSAGAP
jgi:hypothetical protein